MAAAGAEEEKGYPVAEITGLDAKDILAVKSISALAADTVEKARCGHPGAAMALAGCSHLLWSRYLIANPKNPKFLNRDRFVLSNGHAGALQYSMLHLTGYELSMDDLKGFRQLGTLTPGHPEVGTTAGIEVTTGPLGQGIAQGVGMAIAAKHLAAKFNEEGFPLFDSRVYVYCGDGCLQEGVSSEASSLAGHLKLNNLVIIYDDNSITIDGDTALSFTESVVKRYRAYGWQTYVVEKGCTDFEMLARALDAAKESDVPTLIALRTKIGFGSTMEGTAKVHGTPLGTEVMADYKRWLGLDPKKSFAVDDAVYDLYKSTFAKRGIEAETAWNKLLEGYGAKFPAKYALLQRMRSGELPADWRKYLPKFGEDGGAELKKEATRKTNGTVLNALALGLDEIIGGAADLTPSVATQLKCSHDFQRDSYDGRYLRFGVREFGMFAICNGIAAFDDMFVPFSATFCNFITYGWGAVRLGAVAHLRQVYIMTHDSVWIGEDGPTHQPVEVFPLLRATPNLTMWRPADGREINAAWIHLLETAKKGPTVICLTRHSIPPVEGVDMDKALKGAYVVSEESKAEDIDLVLIATGSELHLCAAAAKQLTADGVSVRVVSAPSLEVFDAQPLEYRLSVLPVGAAVLSVEASVATGWLRFAHHSIGLHSFGTSAPFAVLEKHYGFRPEDIAAKARKVIAFAKLRYAGGKAPLLPVQIEKLF